MKKRNFKRLILSSSALIFSLGFLCTTISSFCFDKAYLFNKNTGGTYLGEVEEDIKDVYASKHIVPSDNYYQKSKEYSMNILGDIESTWDNYTGKGTKIAIIDDGFAVNHDEYKRSDGTSALDNASAYFYSSGSSYGVKYYKDNPSNIDQEWDSEYEEWGTHGTATSTTAAAPMNNNGVVGIAPDATILALKIDMSFVGIKAAINYAINQGVDVINMSLGAYGENFTDGFGDSQTGSSSVASYLNSVCNDAYNKGIIVCASAGNEATYHKSYPACNSHVIGVGALYKNNKNKLAMYTNFVSDSQTGEINVDILAPGTVYVAGTEGTSSSTPYTNTYLEINGTSFSSPIVAASACLWKEKYPTGTPDEFLTDLQESADNKEYYYDKYVSCSDYGSKYTDQGPSKITQGCLNVKSLLEQREEKEIDNIEVSIPQDEIAFASNPDVKECLINVNYKDGTSLEDVYPTSAEFVSGYDNKTLGNTKVKLTYKKGEQSASVIMDSYITNKGAKYTKEETKTNSLSMSSTSYFKSSGSSITKDNITYTMTYSSTSSYNGYDGTRGAVQIGSKKNPAKSITLTSSSISNVTKVIVTAAGSTTTSLSVKVGDTSFTCNSSTSTKLTSSITSYEFVGSGSGIITVSYSQSSGVAMYFATLKITSKEISTGGFIADEQALATINYIKSVPSCYSKSNENNMKLAILEYNYQVDDSKASSLWNESFLDGGNYNVTYLEKIIMITNEYNNHVNEEISLITPSGAINKINDNNKIINDDYLIVITSVLLMLTASGLILYLYKRRKDNN